MPCNATFQDEQAHRYVREMTKVLATQDLGQLKEFYGKWAVTMGLPQMPNDAELEKDMHLMILELPGLEHLHESSRLWLQVRGITVEIRDNCCRRAGDLELGEKPPGGGCCGGPRDPGAGQGSD
ncbi:hypothetical protein ACFLQW_04705 [Candidatus Zixiibacteriota bacterium]